MSLLQSSLIVVGIVVTSIVFAWAVRRIWPEEQRREHNDLIGWQLSVVGTTYAVVMGFMLYTVWTDFETATDNTEVEANSLVNVVRSSQKLPVAERHKIQVLARQYAEVMLTQEWPAMNDLHFSPDSHRIVQELWATVIGAQAHNAVEQTSLDHALAQLTEMTNRRRLRQLEAIIGLPGILWTVLIAGAVITIASTCLFSSGNFTLHMVQVVMLSLLLGLMLVAVADINRPFQGAVHVSPAAFERARETIDAYSR